MIVKIRMVIVFTIEVLGMERICPLMWMIFLVVSQEKGIMKTIEALRLNKELLNKLRDAGIRMEDTEYISLYDEYEHMLGKGWKMTYIVACLADKFKVSERTVYSIIKRFGSDCNTDAAT